jgi:hypothetical protein
MHPYCRLHMAQTNFWGAGDCTAASICWPVEWQAKREEEEASKAITKLELALNSGFQNT